MPCNVFVNRNIKFEFMIRYTFDTLTHRRVLYFTTDTLYHRRVTDDKIRSDHLYRECVLKWINKKGKRPNKKWIKSSAPMWTGVVGVREDPNSASSGEWDRQRRRIRKRNGREKTVGTSPTLLWGHVKTAFRIREGGGSYNSQKKPPRCRSPRIIWAEGCALFSPFIPRQYFPRQLLSSSISFKSCSFVESVDGGRKLWGWGFLRAVFLPLFFYLATFPRGLYKVLQSRIF